MILAHSFNQINLRRARVLHLMCKCGKRYKTSTELEFYDIFRYLIRFYASGNYFENMHPFADKRQFTDQNV